MKFGKYHISYLTIKPLSGLVPSLQNGINARHVYMGSRQ